MGALQLQQCVMAVTCTSLPTPVAEESGAARGVVCGRGTSLMRLVRRGAAVVGVGVVLLGATATCGDDGAAGVWVLV